MQSKQLELVSTSAQEAIDAIHALPAELKEHVSPEWLAKLKTVLDSGKSDPWLLGFFLDRKEDGKRVGQCGFKGPPDADGIVEIAYGIEPAESAKGYATEAAASLIEFAFRSPEVELVCAHTLPETNASTRVLEKNGFELKGTWDDPDDGEVWRWELSR